MSAKIIRLLFLSSIRYNRAVPARKHSTKNPPALFVSGRGINVLQVYFQLDVMPSTGLYHAISRFLERMGVLKVQRQLHEPDRITSGGS